MGLLKTYCNRNGTTRQIDGLVEEARGHIGGVAPQRTPRSPRPARAGKQLPAEAERAIVAEYKAGQTMKQIATRHGIHRVTVSEVLDRAGTAKRPRGMDATQVSLAAKLYESGESLATVGPSSASTLRRSVSRSWVSVFGWATRMAASAEALRYSAASAMIRAASNVTYSPSRPRA